MAVVAVQLMLPMLLICTTILLCGNAKAHGSVGATVGHLFLLGGGACRHVCHDSAVALPTKSERRRTKCGATMRCIWGGGVQWLAGPKSATSSAVRPSALRVVYMSSDLRQLLLGLALATVPCTCCFNSSLLHLYTAGLNCTDLPLCLLSFLRR
jgi:hypothetical protein